MKTTAFIVLIFAVAISTEALCAESHEKYKCENLLSLAELDIDASNYAANSNDCGIPIANTIRQEILLIFHKAQRDKYTKTQMISFDMHCSAFLCSENRGLEKCDRDKTLRSLDKYNADKIEIMDCLTR